MSNPLPSVLRDYAVIADGERGAVIGPRGEIAWLCVPSWESPAVFSSLIGGGGICQVCPADDWYTWSGSYESGTLIWRSRFIGVNSVVECREALAFPGDPHRAVLLRRIEAVRGSALMRVRVRPAGEFGAAPPRELRRDGKYWTARLGSVHMRLSGCGDAAMVADGELLLHLTLSAGERHDLVLELSDRPLDDPPPDPDSRWQHTERAWHDAVPSVDQLAGHPYAPTEALHSYAVLRGLTSASGAMVAAATTSLPERYSIADDADVEGNYDYRYAWIRDQCFVAQGVAALGPYPLLDDAVRFVTDRLLADGPKLLPVYTVAGGRLPGVSTLSLPGYPGGVDTVGNGAGEQFQLDVFGEALLLFAAAARHDRLDGDAHAAMTVAAEAVAARWTAPDAGIWELDQQRWTHSRLICAAGLRGVADLLPDGPSWSQLADRIVADADADSRHPSGRWSRSPKDPGVDAALLLPALRGATPIDDPRNVSTVDAVRADLGRDGYLYRFQHGQRRLNEAEGAFLLCGFLMAMAEHALGDKVAAARWFERNRAACGSPGLYTEEYDVVARQLRGNLPQAFVHGALIEAATVLGADG